MDVGIWVAIIAAVGSIVVVLIQKYVKDRTSATAARTTAAALNKVVAEIDKPASDQVIGRTIRCSGWARDVSERHHLWLAVEAGGFTWFKEDEIFVDENSTWEAMIFEDGATAEFAVSLYVANDDAHQKILDWFRTGINTGGQYPELQRLPGTRRIARVDRLRLA
ncbi:MAG TPA: hypothetical protein VGO73_00405 [Pyrinomonadaceae bacterium]|nr:hypothetical protein [Pyrinomonadaceae bacterium]